MTRCILYAYRTIRRLFRREHYLLAGKGRIRLPFGMHPVDGLIYYRDCCGLESLTIDQENELRRICDSEVEVDSGSMPDWFLRPK